MDLSSAVDDASIRMPEGIQGANVRPVLGGLRIVFNHLDIPSGLSGERIDARLLALVGFANRRLEVKGEWGQTPHLQRRTADEKGAWRRALALYAPVGRRDGDGRRRRGRRPGAKRKTPFRNLFHSAATGLRPGALRLAAHGTGVFSSSLSKASLRNDARNGQGEAVR